MCFVSNGVWQRLINQMKEVNTKICPWPERDLLVIMALAKHGRLTVSDVGATIPELSVKGNLPKHISASAISVILKSLWKDKWIKRSEDPDNLRRTFVELTPKAREAYGIYMQGREKLVTEIRDAMALNEDQFALLEDAFERVSKRLTELVTDINSLKKQDVALNKA